MSFAYPPVDHITLTRFKFKCRFCNEKGTNPQHFVDKFLKPEPCPLCKKKKVVTVELIGKHPCTVICETCKGKGQRLTCNLDIVPCPTCGGLGQVALGGKLKVIHEKE